VIFWRRRRRGLLVFKCIVEETSCLLRRFPHEVMFEDGVRRAGD
jgi:hypothetical protein